MIFILGLFDKIIFVCKLSYVHRLKRLISRTMGLLGGKDFLIFQFWFLSFFCDCNKKDNYNFSACVNDPRFDKKKTADQSCLIGTILVNSCKWHTFVDEKTSIIVLFCFLSFPLLFFKFSLPAVDIETNEWCHFHEV